jgi:DNA-binding protein Fis
MVRGISSFVDYNHEVAASVAVIWQRHYEKGKPSHMNEKNSGIVVSAKSDKQGSASDVDDIIEKKLEDIATVLCSAGEGKSRLYEEIISMIERSLFKIALRRTNYVKSAAAAYLGVNRNTFQNRMVKLGMNCQKD